MNLRLASRLAPQRATAGEAWRGTEEVRTSPSSWRRQRPISARDKLEIAGPLGRSDERTSSLARVVYSRATRRNWNDVEGSALDRAHYRALLAPALRGPPGARSAD